jgi:hypothetical protein
MPLQNQKADKMLVHWDEVVGKLRGTTRLEALQTCMWLACPQTGHPCANRDSSRCVW